MLVDSVIGHPHSVRGKISRAGFTVGVIEKQAVSHRAEGVPGQNPVRDLVMDFLRVHVPHVLRVVFPLPLYFAYIRTDRAARLFFECLLLAYPKKFSVGDISPVSHH